MYLRLGPLFPSRLVWLFTVQWHHGNPLWFLIKFPKDVVYSLHMVSLQMDPSVVTLYITAFVIPIFAPR